jgi:hypothetical protein
MLDFGKVSAKRLSPNGWQLAKSVVSVPRGHGTWGNLALLGFEM